MKCYWDAFLDEIVAGKLEDGHEDADGVLHKNTVTLQTDTPAQLLRLRGIKFCGNFADGEEITAHSPP